MSAFWLRKMRTYFKTWDFDKNGVITEDDFVSMARRFAEAEKADPERKAKLMSDFRNVWLKFMKLAEEKHDQGLTLPILIESVKQQRNDPDLIIDFRFMISGLFDLMDVNKDGYLQENEYNRLFDQVGVPENGFDRKSAFDAIDVNKDGQLSIDEFVFAFNEFMFSEDEKSPYTYYFGPLVD